MFVVTITMTINIVIVNLAIISLLLLYSCSYFYYNLKFEPKKVSIKFEKMNGLIYVYNCKTDHFITQGKTYEEIADNLEKRFPDTMFLAAPGALKQVKNDSLSV